MRRCQSLAHDAFRHAISTGLVDVQNGLTQHSQYQRIIKREDTNLA